MKRIFTLLLAGLVTFSALDDAHARPSQPLRVGVEQPEQPSMEEFVPLNELPPEEQLPAAPLLIAAYVAVWFGLFAYVWTLWRRLRKIEIELSQVEARLTGREGTR